jgi:hypothetical protein
MDVTHLLCGTVMNITDLETLNHVGEQLTTISPNLVNGVPSVQDVPVVLQQGITHLSITLRLPLEFFEVVELWDEHHIADISEEVAQNVRYWMRFGITWVVSVLLPNYDYGSTTPTLVLGPWSTNADYSPHSLHIYPTPASSSLSFFQNFTHYINAKVAISQGSALGCDCIELCASAGTATKLARGTQGSCTSPTFQFCLTSWRSSTAASKHRT